MTCAITTSVLGCLATIMLFLRYALFLEISTGTKALLLLLFILMGCIPLFVGYGFEESLGKVFPAYRYSLYFIYIFCIILLSLTIFRDIIWGAGYGISKISGNSFFVSPLDMAWVIKTNVFTALIALLVTTSALWQGIKTPDLKFVTIGSDKIKTEQTIAVLSDLHIHREIAPKKIKEIVEKTNEQNPNIILLAGDIIDDEPTKVKDIVAILKGLKAKSGIYFVTGNHEFYNGYQGTVETLKDLGFTFLENNGRLINEQIYLAGIPDIFSSQDYGKLIDLQQAFAQSQGEEYRILMSHTPADFGIDNNFDLEIAGHTHGGQIFPFHIFAKLHNHYLAGLYDMANRAKIYVSRGAGQWGPQMRFLAPSEITIIKLTTKNGDNVKMKSEIDTIFVQGEKNPYGKFFTGQTYLTMLNINDQIFNAPIGNVTFEPGARTNWHKHTGGQILLVTGGEGRYQERGKEIQIFHKGDVVRIAPDVEHWHGAAPNSWFVHLSIETNVPNNQAIWLEPVTDKEYK